MLSFSYYKESFYEHSCILEHIYFACMLEIHPGMELLDLRVWIRSALVDTAKDFSEVLV